MQLQLQVVVAVAVVLAGVAVHFFLDLRAKVNRLEARCGAAHAAAEAAAAALSAASAAAAHAAALNEAALKELKGSNSSFGAELNAAQGSIGSHGAKLEEMEGGNSTLRAELLQDTSRAVVKPSVFVSASVCAVAWAVSRTRPMGALLAKPRAGRVLGGAIAITLALAAAHRMLKRRPTVETPTVATPTVETLEQLASLAGLSVAQLAGYTDEEIRTLWRVDLGLLNAPGVRLLKAAEREREHRLSLGLPLDTSEEQCAAAEERVRNAPAMAKQILSNLCCIKGAGAGEAGRGGGAGGAG